MKKVKSYSPTASVSNYDLSFKTDMSRDDVVKALEPTIKHAVASGRIYNPQKFRKNLLQATTDFHSVVSGAQHYQQQANWFVNGFMLEIYITAAGDVAPFAAVGAELNDHLHCLHGEDIPESLVRAREIDEMNSNLSELKSFILPGGSMESAYLHLARTSARKAERLIISLSQKEKINPVSIKYINRLSDHLFVSARFVNKQNQKEDILWIPGKSRK